MPKGKTKASSNGRQNKKEKTRSNVGHVALRTAHQLAGESNIDGLRERMLSDPVFQLLIQQKESSEERRITEAQDSMYNLTNRRGYVVPAELLQFPDSPTAQRHLIAFDLYYNGWILIHKYEKDRVLTKLDCSELTEGFHCYAKGRLLEGHLGRQFPLPEHIPTLLVDYHNLCPNDSLVEYLKIEICDFLSADPTISDYEQSKQKIRSYETMANKIEPYKNVELEGIILFDIYYKLGSFYTTTDQTERALDAFEKCYHLNEEDLAATYALGFHYMKKSSEKAKLMLDKYLENAPKCDEKYPNAHYLLGKYFIHHKKFKTAIKYYQLGQKAETFQLPFNTVAYFPPKQMLESFVVLGQTGFFSQMSILDKP